MVHATHSSGIEDGGQVVYGGEACGYVITLEDGTRVYHAGDTGAHADMALIGELYQPEIALLPIGDLYTMGPDDAVEAVKWIAPRRVAPSHYNTWPPIAQDAERWAELIRSQTAAEPVVLKPGESLSL